MLKNSIAPTGRFALSSAMFVATCLLCTGSLEAQQQHVIATKKGTALVETLKDSRRIFSTAFCINASGIFVTNAHVVKGAGLAGKVTLVLNIGEAKQAKITATVIRVDDKTDLALLRAPKTQTYSALELGDTKSLVETVQLTAFGFPFGKTLSVTKGQYPSMSVNVGRITSIRKQLGVIERIQLDAALNPGNSGGPVIDNNGKVAGIVVSGIRGSGVNFVIPVEHLHKLIVKPDVAFAKPTIAYKKRYDPADFTVQVTPLKIGRNSDQRYTVTLSLTGPDGKQRVATASTKDGEKYVIKAAPMAKIDPSGRPLEVTFEFANGSIRAMATNTKIKIGTHALSLADLAELKIEAESCEATTVNGETKVGKMDGSPTVQIDLGGHMIPVDLKKAKRLTIAPPDPEGVGVKYVLNIKSGSDTVFESEGAFNCGSAPASTVVGKPGAVAIGALSGGPKTISLPAPCTDVAMGGSGRFIVLYLQTLRKLAVYDVHAVKIAGYIPLSGEDVKFAAGANNVIVVYKAENILQRWSLPTLKKNLTLTAPIKGVVHDVVMGSASHTLLLHYGQSSTSGSGGAFKFFDSRTMREIPVKYGNNSGMSRVFGNRANIRVSSNGQLYGMWRTGVSPTGLISCLITGNTAQSWYAHTSAGCVLPDASGTTLYTSRGGIYSAQLKRLDDTKSSYVLMAPAHHPAYYIAVPTSARSSRSSRSKVPQRGSVYTKGSITPLAALPEMPEMVSKSSSSSSRSGSYGDFTYEKRYHFYPHLNMLITIPPSNDKLIVRPYDIRKALEEKGIDYLYVISTPPTEAKAGKLFSYQLKAESKSGRIRYKLDSAPLGMKISSSGLISWRATKPSVGGWVSVIASVSDRSGQEVFHSFKLSVQ